MKAYGIPVCALCLGSTESEFHAVASQERFTSKHQESAEKVARTGLKALAAGKSYVISGLCNYLGAHSQRAVPRRMVTRIAAGMFWPDQKR
jgi:short-subunit dehydrogenase